MTEPGCRHCGAPLRPQARFCARCGRPADVSSELTGALRGGDYQIVRSISKGGMGAIYLARDTRAFGRLCVIKQMLTYYDASDALERQRAQARFQEEGRTLAYLSHPGIPKIYTFFEEDGAFYLVMEYIEGQNLEAFVSRRDSGRLVLPVRRLHQEEVVRYAVQVCRILEYLHGQQRPVIHLDIKPANLILEAQLGDVRLVDFGTAGVRPATGQLPTSGQEGAYGTDGYAPPEQYRGQPVPRSDVFAAAATIYHLLTDDDPREHPFKWPRLTTLPRELSLALQRALRPDPERRSTANELRQALETLSTPSRVLETFTFPGNAQIKTVGALPALSDEHWDAARRFLYGGDFTRWLRDLNRHDLAVSADELLATEPNQDAGLERFLHQVDGGLPQPQVSVDRPTVDLGGVARESALIEHVSVTNQTRGYVQANVVADQPWIEAFPLTLDLRAGRTADLSLTIRAEDLPLRRQQRGVVTITGAEGAETQITVLARVSIWREVLRIIWRAVATALPGAWRQGAAAWRFNARLAQGLVRPFVRHPWLFWLLWLLCSGGVAAGLFYGQAGLTQLLWVGPQIEAFFAVERVARIGLVAALAPPVLVVGVLLLLLVVSVAGGVVYGAVEGVWRSFAR